MQADGIAFDNALRRVAIYTVFTTHTPVPAGHDRFSPDLVEELFPHTDPIDRQVMLGNRRFRVVGILESKGGAQGQTREPLLIEEATITAE